MSGFERKNLKGQGRLKPSDLAKKELRKGHSFSQGQLADRRSIKCISCCINVSATTILTTWIGKQDIKVTKETMILEFSENFLSNSCVFTPICTKIEWNKMYLGFVHSVNM